ncbi:MULTISPECIES: AraC family transcriptional regulator [unclassified Fusibacter]|uniref:AraC family transcriptional regulator n=1 Tax=unclassified Fusibacter TaxID=2624464 RepID=UPI001011747B|nr:MULTISPECIES: AraC family transcriptional regulator [unclassified Fusibacter]MCK8060585.1 AraC family transcriptional regulator [Fusibacter sp. A2]NPE22961.1 AraC family transcriptional regulator [Fusibacter sp. A1]RXV60026.1 AraC family transcriptional regulator [Fusibacter sp. A1]
MITLQTLIDNFGYKLLTDGVDTSREIRSLGCCDLLSWVMANGKEDEAWITVQTHTNILAVTSLLDMACIIIPEGITVETATLEKANEKNIPIFSTSESPYAIFTRFYESGLR